MIARALESAIRTVSPRWAVRRAQAREILRSYTAADSGRLHSDKRPRNRPADSELRGPFGADKVRAWSRELVRNNAYAWGVVDTIVSSVVGCGIHAQSMLETVEGEDVEDVNWARDEVWQRWCEVCDVNGQYSFIELQRMVQREIVEAGEVLIHLVGTRDNEYRGISRPVPLALELIEADRLASDQDTFVFAKARGARIVRGVEMDELGKPVAYWIYPEHPDNNFAATGRTPERISATSIIHLFRRDRIGQSRGVSWFAPVTSWLRDLGLYVDNEIQASAVASCFGVAIKTEMPFDGLNPNADGDASDSDGNSFDYLEPALITHLRPGEDIATINPGRPNSASEPWISLMLRGIAVGTGLSYEVVARDYSKTTYSSSRTSQLEDRRRFRCWQQYLILHLCQPVWDRFCEAAALSGHEAFPPMSDLLEDRRKAVPVEWQTPEWEWVDPSTEQAASKNSIDSLQSTYQVELGSRGRNWRQVFYQRAKEEELKRKLGLQTLEQSKIAAGVQEAAVAGGTGELSDMGRRQFLNNRKAIKDVLGEFISGVIGEAEARVLLSGIGLNEQNVAALIADAADGSVDSLPAEEDAVT